MNDPSANDLNELITRALRDELSNEEQASFEHRLAVDSALRHRFQEEKALEELLNRVPDVPVPTNFTSLVLQSVRRETRAAVRTPRFGWFRYRFTRVATGLAVVVAAGVLVLQQYREAERARMARSVSAFTEVAAVIGSGDASAIFRDFEAIEQLSLPAETELDLELLFALQQ